MLSGCDWHRQGSYVIGCLMRPYASDGNLGSLRNKASSFESMIVGDMSEYVVFV
jgi:hypothetical protein